MDNGQWWMRPAAALILLIWEVIILWGLSQVLWVNIGIG